MRRRHAVRALQRAKEPPAQAAVGGTGRDQPDLVFHRLSACPIAKTLERHYRAFQSIDWLATPTSSVGNNRLAERFEHHINMDVGTTPNKRPR